MLKRSKQGKFKTSKLQENSDTENEASDKQNWNVEYMEDEVKIEQNKEQTQEFIIEEDSDDPLDEQFLINEESSLVKNAEPGTLTDQLILAKIKLIQTQRELAEREMEFIKEKTKFLQRQIKGCKCGGSFQIN